MILSKNITTVGILLLFLVISCKNLNDNEHKPDHFIEKDDFEQILSDLEKAEAYIHMQYTKQNKVAPEGVYLAVFAKHHISKAQFDSCLLYYANHPEYLEESYNQILEQLTKQQAEINAKLSVQKED
jgi:hypothetical protein